jgi:hypothetical protein
LKKQDELDTKYSQIGIFLTFLGASILAIFIGLVLYWTGAILGFHIPFIFPALTIILISIPIVSMGKNLGHCRNLPLAISIPVFASILVWVTEHFAGSLLFHSDNSIPLTIIKFGGMVLPITFTSNNFWATAYWIIELVMLVWLTARINTDYPLQPYCEKCNAWHKFKTPVAGTDAKLEQAQNAVKANDMLALIEFLSDDQGDNVTHFDLEYCPKCYGNSARLVIAKNAGNGSWEEKIVWEETLEPKYAQELIQHAI